MINLYQVVNQIYTPGYDRNLQFGLFVMKKLVLSMAVGFAQTLDKSKLCKIQDYK